ncbi:hypothetical protein HK104_008894 [Borealophlyctis nickersoniae]|nr:hypothetical protein HK104_008894 [Borealophlyctis nickersoniae]
MPRKQANSPAYSEYELEDTQPSSSDQSDTFVEDEGSPSTKTESESDEDRKKKRQKKKSKRGNGAKPNGTAKLGGGKETTSGKRKRVETSSEVEDGHGGNVSASRKVRASGGRGGGQKVKAGDSKPSHASTEDWDTIQLWPKRRNFTKDETRLLMALHRTYPETYANLLGRFNRITGFTAKQLADKVSKTKNM